MANIATCALSLKPRIGRQPLRDGPEDLPFTSYRAPASQWSGSFFRPEETPAAPEQARGVIAQWTGSADGPKVRAAAELLFSLAAQGHHCVWVEAQGRGATVPRKLPAGWEWARAGVYTAFSLREAGLSPRNPVRAGGTRSSPATWAAGARKQRLWEALRAVEQLLADRRWAMVVLHLGRWLPSDLRDIPKWTWARLQAAVHTGGTGLVVLVDRRCPHFRESEVHRFGARELPRAESRRLRLRFAKAAAPSGKRKLRVYRPLRDLPPSGVFEPGLESGSGNRSPNKPFLVPRAPKRAPFTR